MKLLFQLPDLNRWCLCAIAVYARAGYEKT